MKMVLFVLNPIAGAGKAKSLIPMIKEIMDKHKIGYHVILTTRPLEAISIAEDNVDDYETIVAVGGDGTVNEVARGLINKNRGTLGIIPGGTGNDMAKSLNISLDPKEALEILLKGYKKDMDIGIVNGVNFLNIASVGFDAEVVQNNVRIKKKIKNSISYAISVVYTLLSFKKKKIQINIDGKTINEEVILLAVGNGRYYGGGMMILPMADIDDGYLDICLISGLGKIKILFLFPSIFKGKHIKYTRYVKIFKGKEIEVISDDGIYLNVDGDVFEKKNHINFSIADKRLSLICGIE